MKLGFVIALCIAIVLVVVLKQNIKPNSHVRLTIEIIEIGITLDQVKGKLGDPVYYQKDSNGYEMLTYLQDVSNLGPHEELGGINVVVKDGVVYKVMPILTD